MQKDQSEFLIEVNGVSKKFSRSLKRSMLYGLKDMTRNLFGLPAKSSELRKEEFWAVKDVSFKLKRGECVGLIGKNGAGKSTLLKMLNGLIPPDEGTITMRGRIGALIELGAGFNPLLTGRENIHINGQLLGLTRKEVDDRLESIIDFSEIRDFIDSPVQNYSSGMKVRLGFAVAAQMEPDILIIDEVLAVGDGGFRMKCLNRIHEELPNMAVIFVSHSMPQVAKVSTEIVLMEKGQIRFNGKNIHEGIERYLSQFDIGKNEVMNDGMKLISLLVNGMESNQENRKNGIPIGYLEDMVLQFTVDNYNNLRSVDFVVRMYDISIVPVATIQHQIQLNDGVQIVTLRVPKIQFSTGKYSMDIFVTTEGQGKRGEKIVCAYKNYCVVGVTGAKVKNYACFQLYSELIS